MTVKDPRRPGGAHRRLRPAWISGPIAVVMLAVAAIVAADRISTSQASTPLPPAIDVTSGVAAPPTDSAAAQITLPSVPPAVATTVPAPPPTSPDTVATSAPTSPGPATRSSVPPAPTPTTAAKEDGGHDSAGSPTTVNPDYPVSTGSGSTGSDRQGGDS